MELNKDEVYMALERTLSLKPSASGWQSFNAVCCTHNGQPRPDKRHRGGIRHEVSGKVGYHCFNCGYKAMYVPGQRLSRKMKNVLEWAGIPPTDLKKIEFNNWLFRDKEQTSFIPRESLSFEPESLPKGAMPFSHWMEMDEPPIEFLLVADYVNNRTAGNILDYDFYWTPERKQVNPKTLDMNQRVIIPFRWKGEIVGWTGRKITDGNPKYFSKEQKNFIFNTEAISPDDKVIFVTEGPFDALSINGVAMLGDRCTRAMADWLNDQNKEIVVVPDRMNHGGNLVDIAMKNDWSVSFPDWGEGIKDANDAVMTFGKLWVVQSIIASTKKSKVGITVSRTKI